MPIITQTKADMLRALPTTPGWYEAKIVKAVHEASKDKQSQNVIVTVVLSSGKEIQSWFNSKMGYGDLFKVSASIQGVNLNKVSGDKLPDKMSIDLDAMVGKPVKVYVDNDLYNGNLMDKVTIWIPTGENTEVPF